MAKPINIDPIDAGVERLCDRLDQIQGRLDNHEPLTECEQFLADLFPECLDSE